MMNLFTSLMATKLNLSPKKQLKFDQNKQAIADGGLGVDFLPTTGRWRVVDQNATMRGGVDAFLQWHDGQVEADD